MKGELINQYWEFTNDSDRCRLYNNAGTSFFYFSAKSLGCESVTIGAQFSNGTLYLNSPNVNATAVLDVEAHLQQHFIHF